jgi:antitoxin FitA
MAALSIRNLDDGVKRRLRIRAARRGRSMEAEIRSILEEAVSETETPDNPFETFMTRFAQIGGVDLDFPQRSVPVRGADFS